jgi:hypothetical protein
MVIITSLDSDSWYGVSATGIPFSENFFNVFSFLKKI